MINFRMRRYQTSDAEPLRQLFRDTVHHINRRDYSQTQVDVWAADEYDVEQWCQRLDRMRPWVAIAENDRGASELVGYGGLIEGGLIDQFFVHHLWQGQGIARMLMQEIEREARDLKLLCIYADVSLTAQPFFNAAGFEIVQEQTVTLHGIQFRNARMEKRLN